MNRNAILILLIFISKIVLSQNTNYIQTPVRTQFNLYTGYCEPKALGAGGRVPTAFHEGLDIYVTNGETIDAARSGYVEEINIDDDPYKTYIIIKAPLTKNPDPLNLNDWEYDVYLHISPGVGLIQGQYIDASSWGNYIGHALYLSDDEFNHIHFARLSSLGVFHESYTIGATNSLNPLSIMPTEYKDWPEGVNTPPVLN